MNFNKSIQQNTVGQYRASNFFYEQIGEGPSNHMCAIYHLSDFFFFFLVNLIKSVCFFPDKKKKKPLKVSVVAPQILKCMTCLLPLWQQITWHWKIFTRQMRHKRPTVEPSWRCWSEAAGGKKKVFATRVFVNPLDGALRIARRRMICMQGPIFAGGKTGEDPRVGWMKSHITGHLKTIKL